MADLTVPEFTNEEAAREALEAVRWPNGPVCPHCGSVETATKMQGKSHRPGLYQCNGCRGSFSVTVGTVYERSHIPLHKWLLATHLMASSKKGISAHQLHRMLGITYKSAWFMAHRIREAMAPASTPPMSGDLEVDETYIGNRPGHTPARGYKRKMGVLSLVERGGTARSIHFDTDKPQEIARIVKAHADKSARLHTDEAATYRKIGRGFASHDSVNHKKGEWARGQAGTNTVEGFFSVFKRGMKGVYQHCGEQHLDRYLAEFDFRYSNRVKLGVDDKQRATKALKGIEGKRLTYRRINEKQAEADTLG
jgi:transposase-like protein